MTSIFFIFYQKKAFLNYEKWFLFPLKSSFCSWDIEYFAAFFFSLSQFPDLKGQTEKGVFLIMFCNSKGDWYLVSGLFCFHHLVHKWGLGAKKNQINFFIVSFKISYFQKSFACTDCLGLFAKIKKGYRTSF